MSSCLGWPTTPPSTSRHPTASSNTGEPPGGCGRSAKAPWNGSCSPRASGPLSDGCWRPSSPSRRPRRVVAPVVHAPALPLHPARPQPWRRLFLAGQSPLRLPRGEQRPGFSWLVNRLYRSGAASSPRAPSETLLRHCDRVVDLCESRFLPGTALVNYGDGDWDDTLQPADPAMRTRMVSSWTVGLAYHAFRQLAEVCRRVGQDARAQRLVTLLERMRRDFSTRLMPGGVVAGFLVTKPDGASRPLLHPADRVTGIRYRLLPMTRSILAELFSREDATRHAALVANELSYPDGVRLMSEPAAYHGGCEHLFKRADTAANVGREIGLMYVHAHLRYAEAMAKLGEADHLWEALQVVNPVGLAEAVPHARARQANVYFSSSGRRLSRPDRGGQALEGPSNRVRRGARRLAALFKRSRPFPSHRAGPSPRHPRILRRCGLRSRPYPGPRRVVGPDDALRTSGRGALSPVPGLLRTDGGHRERSGPAGGRRESNPTGSGDSSSPSGPWPPTLAPRIT